MSPVIIQKQPGEKPWAACVILFLDIIVVNLDTEDYTTAGCRNEICQEQRPDNIGLMQQPLKHEGEPAYSHHQESRKGDSIGVLSTNRLYRLW